MDDKEYIKQRLDTQKAWYSSNSSKNQKTHKFLQIIQIFSAANIPFLSSVIDKQTTLNITVGALGVLIAVITGIIAVYKFEDKWIRYRTTAESLKHQKFLYQTRVDPYNGAEPFPVLVKNIESLISQENNDWSQNNKKLNSKKTA